MTTIELENRKKELRKRSKKLRARHNKRKAELRQLEKRAEVAQKLLERIP